MLNFLKHHDIFSQPAEIFMSSRDRKNNQKSYKDSHGSVFGGILTIWCYMSTIGYLVAETNKMMNG